MPDRPQSHDGDPDLDEADELARRLESFFLEDESGDGDLRDLLLKGDVEDPERLLHLMALHELAEEGLELLAEEGISESTLSEHQSRIMGDYRLVREIGSGGMGVVYLAEELSLGRVVALKVLSRRGTAGSERFRREAEITASLNHPNIVPVFGRGEQDGVEFLAMRYIAGRDILTTVNQARQGDTGGTRGLYLNIVSWMADIARALHQAHEAGVLHRDVKPSNILVEDNTPFIVDFGLARHSDHMDLTQPGDMLGTVPYMSPEQIRGDVESFDPRLDIYGMGATLYHLLAGTLPFAGRNSQAMARLILTRDPAPLRTTGVPPDLEAIVFKCLEKEPARRYATAEDLACDLERFARGETVLARHLGPLRRAGRMVLRNRLKFAAAAVLVLVLAAGSAMLWRSRADRRKAQAEVFRVAMAAADQAHYDDATRMLRGLKEKGAALDGLDEALSRFRKFALHDDLMTFLYVRNAQGVAVEQRGAPHVLMELLKKAEALSRPDVLSEQFRFLRIVTLKRLGRAGEAKRLLNQWQEEGPDFAWRVQLLRLYLERTEGSTLSEADMAQLAAGFHERSLDDHYFAGLVLALFDGGQRQGLLEIEAWLGKRPGDYWGRFIRGNLLRQIRRYDAAREVYSGLVASLAGSGDFDTRNDPKLSAALYQRGLLSSRLGFHDQALQDFDVMGELPIAWLKPRARAHALFGLGRFQDALRAYDEALAGLEMLRRESSEAEQVRQDLNSNLAGVLQEKTRTLMALGRTKEAQEVCLILGAMPGWHLRAEELLAFMMIQNMNDPRGGTAMTQGAVMAELQDLVEEYPESDVFKYLVLELRARHGSDEERMAILDDLYAREDVNPELRYWRAWISFIAVEGRRRTFFDRRRREGVSEELRQEWLRLEEETAVSSRRAADDLGVLQLDGFERLEGIFRDRQMARFLLGALRLWAGEPRQAVAMFASVRQGRGWEKQPWSSLMCALHGQALESLGFYRQALEVYRRGMAQSTVDDWCLTGGARLAARQGWWKDLEELLETIRQRQPHPRWLARELRHPVYLRARREGHLPDLSR